MGANLFLFLSPKIITFLFYHLKSELLSELINAVDERNRHKEKKKKKGTKDIYEWPEEKGLSGEKRESSSFIMVLWYCDS